MSIIKSSSIRKKKVRSNVTKTNLDWSDPFLISNILAECEVSYHGKRSSPEKLFSQDEIEVLNFSFFSIIYRLQKELQQKVVSEADFFKDDHLHFAQLNLKIPRNISLLFLHSFIEHELKKNRKKLAAFPVKISADIQQDSARPYRELKFHLDLIV